jgi:acetylglutamate/LysW-gamma-L-alpha-aminoadipate kinase
MIVVKVGGGQGIDLDAVCRDVASLVEEGQDIILVHGGSGETNRIAEKLGHPPRFVTSPSGFTSRFTDRETLEIFEMVYCGKINKHVVEYLQRLGVNAVGLSGLDGRLLEGRRKESVRIREQGKRRVLHGDFTGTVETVNTALLQMLLEGGYLPVITPPAISYDSEGINVDGDRAAAAIARAMSASELVILSSVPGLLRDFPNEDTLIRHIDRASVDGAMVVAEGRMKKKVLGAVEALDGGVGRVVLADGRVEAPIRRALDGQGTVIE